MRGKELMIGDLVAYNGDITVVDRGDFGNAMVTTRYRPVQLTAEILEKNGFKYNGDTGCYESEYFSLRHMADGKWGVGNTMMRVSGVHELQHALRLCETGREIIL